MNMCDVSVIIPSYNYSRFIGEAIDSVLNQTYDCKLEIIIIDDGSSDYSPRIIEEYEQKFPEVRAVFHSENKGIPHTFNTGIEQSSGEYLSILSSDDIWFKNKLSKQMDVIKKSGSSNIIWSEGALIDESSKPLGRKFTDEHNATNKNKSGDVLLEMLRHNFILGSSLLFDKNVLDGLRFNTDLTYLNDYLFFVQLAEKHEFEFISEPLAGYRRHGDNATENFTGNEEYYRDCIKVREIFLEEYKDTPPEIKAHHHYKLAKYHTQQFGNYQIGMEHLKKSIQLDKSILKNIDEIIYLMVYNRQILRQSLKRVDSIVR